MQKSFSQNLKKNTDFNEDEYKIVFTNDCLNEMDYIYNYISNRLFVKNFAIKLMEEVKKKILGLKYMPHKNAVIKAISELDMEYRRIVVKNYVIIYTILEKEKTVYIIKMFYGKSNYLEEF